MLFLGWIGKAVTVILMSYAVGRLLSEPGMNAAGREVWSVGVFVLSVLLAALFIRLVLRLAQKPR